MKYMHADIQHVSTGVWRSYVKELELFASSTSKPKLEHETYRLIEESYGLHSFSIVWNEC